jgi:hypothetical protein
MLAPVSARDEGDIDVAGVLLTVLHPPNAVS